MVGEVLRISLGRLEEGAVGGELAEKGEGG